MKPKKLPIDFGPHGSQKTWQGPSCPCLPGFLRGCISNVLHLKMVTFLRKKTSFLTHGSSSTTKKSEEGLKYTFQQTLPSQKIQVLTELQSFPVELILVEGFGYYQTFSGRLA